MINTLLEGAVPCASIELVLLHLSICLSRRPLIMRDPIDSRQCAGAMPTRVTVKIQGQVPGIIGYLQELFNLVFSRLTRVRQRNAVEPHSRLFDGLLFVRVTTAFQVDNSSYLKRCQIYVVAPLWLRPAIVVLGNSPEVLNPIFWRR